MFFNTFATKLYLIVKAFFPILLVNVKALESITVIQQPVLLRPVIRGGLNTPIVHSANFGVLGVSAGLLLMEHNITYLNVDSLERVFIKTFYEN